MSTWIIYALLSAFFAALDRLSVVFVLALALLFLGEHFTWKSSLGAFFIATGAILMVIK